MSDPERLTGKIRAALAPCSLGDWPTPLERAPALAMAAGVHALWLKREDRSAAPCGGNKVRGLEFLLAGARAGTVFVTVGATGSTHCLATAVHAARLSCAVALAQFPQPETDSSRAVAAACAAHAALVVRAQSPAGLPLAVLVFTQWWLATDKPQADKAETGKKSRASGGKKSLPVEQHDSRFPPATRRMIAAGVAAGLLPLVHAHSFVVVMAMGGCLALLHIRWREWITFFVLASVIAIPQLLWSTSHSAVDAGSFFAWELGWDHGNDNPIWFWFKNTGIFIPLIFVAVLTRGNGYLVRKRLLLFYLPFTLCFIIPNFVKLAPWIWDNIKVLYYWWLASTPLVALLLARLWRQGPIRRAIAAVLFVCVTLAGTLDVAGIALGHVSYQVFDAAGIRFAELIKEKTPPRATIVHAPVHNTPVFLTGRRSLMGYPGHIWTHGLQFVQREAEIKRIYLGMPDADQLLRNYNIEYAVVGPHEQVVTPVNERFFSRFQKVGEVGEYRLYKINPQ